MDMITLRTDLLQQLEISALMHSKDLNEIVNDAIESYLREQQQQQLDQEIAAYEGMHSSLVKTHSGKWVAVHQQKLVDHDEDRIRLYRRIKAKYNQTPVLIRQVMEHPAPEIWLRTPTTGKS